jgi:chromosome segregation ATPase
MVAVGKMNKTELIARVQELEKTDAQLHEMRDNLCVEVNALRGRLEDKDIEIKELKEENENQKILLQNLKKEWDDAERRAQEAVSHWSEKVKEAETQLEDLTELWNKKVKECDNWKEKFVQSSHQLEMKLDESDEVEKKVEVFEDYLSDCEPADEFNEWVANVEIKGKRNYHWELVQELDTSRWHLKQIKDIPAKIEMWENVMESGDAEPELLLDAIAERLNLSPIEWGTPGCAEKSYELWEKIADTMNEP